MTLGGIGGYPSFSVDESRWRRTRRLEARDHYSAREELVDSLRRDL